jgi:hypothetical protein
MVEIALSLAVVAFALVAIIGVLPLGMTVQKDNREDTLIAQEARYWIEALKSGAEGLHDLTNYVEYIKIDPTNANSQFQLVEIDNSFEPHLKAHEIIGLLSIPKYEGGTTNSVTNRITARVRAITGPATEQSPFTNTFPNTFRYQLQTEWTPYYPMPPALVGRRYLEDPTNNLATLNFNEAVGANLWDVRLVLRWPVIERGNDWFIGNNRKTFRARISGVLQSHTNFNRLAIPGRKELYLFDPNFFNVATIQQP